MSRPLNGCMCQDGTCESCNRVVEAFEAVRQALRVIFKAAKTAYVTLPLLPDKVTSNEVAIKKIIDRARAALALAEKVLNG